MTMRKNDIEIGQRVELKYPFAGRVGTVLEIRRRVVGTRITIECTPSQSGATIVRCGPRTILRTLV